MAPKGAKRAAPTSKEEPEAKRVAAFLKQHGVTKSSHEAIREIVQHPLADLPSECRDMLLAMLPWSLGVPSDLRGERHNEGVQMVEEVAASIQASMGSAIEVESAHLHEMDEKKAEFQLGVQSAEAALAEAAGSLGERKRELAEASAALLQQKRALGEAENKQKTAASDLEKTLVKKIEVENVMTDNFRRLKDGEWQPGEEEGLFRPVQALIGKLNLDESLVTSLPVSLKKQGRGPFDQVVVDKFEEALHEKVAELGNTIGDMENATGINATAVEEAKTALENAQAKQQEIAGEFGAAQEANTKAIAKVKDAERALAAFEPDYVVATAARKAKADELETFQTYHMGILKMMVEKVSKEKEAELAKVAQEKASGDDQKAVVEPNKEAVADAQASADATQASAAEAGA